MGNNNSAGDYSIENFGSYELDEDRTIRNGFIVYANFGTPQPYARCFEGYCLATDAQGIEQIETDTFYLAWVGVFNERRRGVGTTLIARALEEASARGFHTARMEVENPQVISVVRKIGQTGLITNVQYALTGMENEKLINVLPTAQFYRHPNLLTDVEAAKYLESFPHAENGLIMGSSLNEVECVLKFR